MDEEKELERVIVLAENSESMDAIRLAAEVRRLRKIEDGLKNLIAMRKHDAEASGPIGRNDMHESQLKWIKERLEGHDVGKYHDASDMAVGFGEIVNDARDLVEEVERLNGRLEAVCAIVSDACAFGEDLSALRILEAVRGA